MICYMGNINRNIQFRIKLTNDDTTFIDNKQILYFKYTYNYMVEVSYISEADENHNYESSYLKITFFPNGNIKNL